MAQPKTRITVPIPPFREIKLNSRPYAQRAITFSCDGELAVAADDSIHVMVPEFPDPDYAVTHPAKNRTDDNAKDRTQWTQVVGIRAQYSQGGLHFPVSHPPIHPRVNEELFDAAGLPFPYGEGVSNKKASKRKALDEDKDEDEDEDESSDADDAQSQASSNRPFGAGYGPLTGFGSTLNHVVCIGWSPSGLGVNRRPVLAVMTARGTVTIYGDRTATNALGMAKVNEGMLRRRGLDDWGILWGVGERLVVPGQQTEISENIQSFAWAHQIGPGQALFSYMTDGRELVILSVQSIQQEDIEKDDGSTKGMSGSHERSGMNGAVMWTVHEVARFPATGPHPEPSMLDPDWTPVGSAFALSFSPWMHGEQSRSCLLSHIGRHYIGFRKITIQEPWTLGELPNIVISEEDAHGECLHLSTDAFFQFENAIWTRGTSKICRGIAVTGSQIRTLEASLVGGSEYHITARKPDKCGTMYESDDLSKSAMNPIVDLIIHPPNLTKATEAPLYSLIRLSATQSNDNWYETNVPMPEDPLATRNQPAWATELAQKLRRSDAVDELPKSLGEGAAGAAKPHGPTSEDGASGNSDDDEDDDAAAFAGLGGGAHDQRFRLYGLAASPAGGMSAVLAMPQSAVGPERDNWHNKRSSVLFDSQPAPSPSLAGTDTSDENRAAMAGNPHLTAEGRMWEYMYGGGPDVVGVTTTERGERDSDEDEAARKREALKALFRESAATQTCDLDGRPMQGDGRLTTCGWHSWGTCGTSGLAIMVIGVARSCGVCGARTLPLDLLVRKLPEKRDEIMALAAGDFCGRCGGKFLH